MSKKKKMLSPKEYAQSIERPYTTVMTWLQNNQLPEAVQLKTPSGNFWAIPEGTTPPVLRRGPKATAKKSGKKTQKRES